MPSPLSSLPSSQQRKNEYCFNKTTSRNMDPADNWRRIGRKEDGGANRESALTADVSMTSLDILVHDLTALPTALPPGRGAGRASATGRGCDWTAAGGSFPGSRRIPTSSGGAGRRDPGLHRESEHHRESRTSVGYRTNLGRCRKVWGFTYEKPPGPCTGNCCARLQPQQ